MLLSFAYLAFSAVLRFDYRRDGKMALYSLTEQGRELLGLADIVPVEQIRG
jgi:hypothetical protein